MTTKPVPKTSLEVSLGAHFRKVRKEREFTLDTLRKALGVSVNTLRWHEAGARSMRLNDVVRAVQIMQAGNLPLVPDAVIKPYAPPPPPPEEPETPESTTPSTEE